MCSADYKVLLLSASFAGSTHDYTDFQSSKLYMEIMNVILPSWVIVAEDEAYSNEMNIVTPYGGQTRDELQSNCDHSILRCTVKIEKAFRLLVNRFCIFCSPIRFRLPLATRIIGVCAKVNNYIIDMKVNHSNDLEVHEDSNFTGSPSLYW